MPDPGPAELARLIQQLDAALRVRPRASPESPDPATRLTPPSRATAFLRACLDREQAGPDREFKRTLLDEYEARDRDAGLMTGPASVRQREWLGLRVAMRAMLELYREVPGYQEASESLA